MPGEVTIFTAASRPKYYRLMFLAAALWNALAAAAVLFLISKGPCCSESTAYGGWQPHFRAKIALFGNNCSPVVPQPFSSVSQYTDLSSHGCLWNTEQYKL
jgi:hypothetical protein